ncbi:hypothetical protein MRB53_037338 [Persea americana]|nr:hypothetical protein MRB53_037338 [Persea americana]
MQSMPLTSSTKSPQSATGAEADMDMNSSHSILDGMLTPPANMPSALQSDEPAFESEIEKGPPQMPTLVRSSTSAVHAPRGQNSVEHVATSIGKHDEEGTKSCHSSLIDLSDHAQAAQDPAIADIDADAGRRVRSRLAHRQPRRDCIIRRRERRR